MKIPDVLKNTGMNWTGWNPGKLLYFIRMVRRFFRADRRRVRLMTEHDTKIPPVIIYSITGKCNLECKGCYAGEYEKHDILNPVEVKSLLEQARQLGIFYFLVAGGEPLLDMDILKVMAGFRKSLFLVFTNAMLLDDKAVEYFARHRNLIPVISFEGDLENTDRRRGKGVFDKVMATAAALRKKGVLAGFSVTMDNNNKAYIVSNRFIRNVRKLFNFGIVVAYQPLVPGAENALNMNEYGMLCERLRYLAGENSFTLLNFPGDEDKIAGGCMSSGEVFIHINPRGDVEPCPFAGISADNIKEKKLLDILKSPYLKNVRESKGNMQTIEKGSCLLANNIDVLKKIKETGTRQ